VKLVPVIITEVPVPPDAGLKPVIVGAAVILKLVILVPKTVGVEILTTFILACDVAGRVTFQEDLPSFNVLEIMIVQVVPLSLDK